ncbi:hypothetical protein [Alistipes putredinis]|uniref:hypothetical protein n=1 Tax=Alistipes putredinis TaxID=28117 RepID=UPI0039F4CB2B
MKPKVSGKDKILRELIDIYEQLWRKARHGGRWSTLDKMLACSALTIILAVIVIFISILVLLIS